jgi:hypothetical protein
MCSKKIGLAELKKLLKTQNKGLEILSIRAAICNATHILNNAEKGAIFRHGKQLQLPLRSALPKFRDVYAR